MVAEANWICAGQTQGRARNDRLRQVGVAIKPLWRYFSRSELAPRFRPDKP